MNKAEKILQDLTDWLSGCVDFADEVTPEEVLERIEFLGELHE